MLYWLSHCRRLKMATVSNIYIQRLSRCYEQLLRCKLVSEKKASASTCAEFDAICNGCSPISIEEQAVVATIRGISRASESGSVFSAAGLQHYSIVVGGLILANNLGISDIAYVTYSTNEIFSKCIPKKKYNSVPDVGKKKIMNRPAGANSTADGTTNPKSDEVVPNGEEDYPPLDNRPQDRHPVDKPSRKSKYVPLRPPERPTLDDAEKAVKTIPKPKQGVAAWREYSTDRSSPQSKYKSAKAESHGASGVTPEKDTKQGINKPIEDAADATHPAADTEPSLPTKNAKSSTKRPPRASTRKKAPLMVLDDFMQLKSDIMAETIRFPAETVQSPADPPAASPAKNVTPVELPVPQDQLSKSWADIAEEDDEQISKK
jgi:hypothetical protein